MIDRASHRLNTQSSLINTHPLPSPPTHRPHSSPTRSPHHPLTHASPTQHTRITTHHPTHIYMYSVPATPLSSHIPPTHHPIHSSPNPLITHSSPTHHQFITNSSPTHHSAPHHSLSPLPLTHPLCHQTQLTTHSPPTHHPLTTHASHPRIPRVTFSASNLDDSAYRFRDIGMCVCING